MRENKGSTIIESLIAVGLVMLLIVIIGLLQTVVQSNRHIRNRSLAFNLATEEIEAVRAKPFDLITNITNGNFIEIPNNIGNWAVTNVASPPSSPNGLQNDPSSGSPSGLTGLYLLPNFNYSDFTLETKIRISSSSPVNWETGLGIRMHDNSNYYKISFTSSTIYIYKVVNGTPTLLTSKAKVFSQNTWYTVRLITSGNSFECIINGASELTTSDTNSTYSKGYISLLTFNGAIISVDDVSVTAGSTLLWNFDSDTRGEQPSEWIRFGLNDLPSGQGKLTISDDQVGTTNLKKIVSKVMWVEKGITYTVQMDSLISK